VNDNGALSQNCHGRVLQIDGDYHYVNRVKGMLSSPGCQHHILLGGKATPKLQ